MLTFDDQKAKITRGWTTASILDVAYLVIRSTTL